MIKKCCYCKKITGFKKPYMNLTTTHGICKKCLPRVIEEINHVKENRKTAKGKTC